MTASEIAETLINGNISVARREITLDEFGQPIAAETAMGCGDILDVTESWLACEKCGQLGYDELEDHGINPDWQAP